MPNPIYTFQRPRRRKPRPRSQRKNLEYYTSTDIDTMSEDTSDKYSKYTFFLVLTMLVITIISACFITLKGLPVRIKA